MWYDQQLSASSREVRHKEKAIKKLQSSLEKEKQGQKSQVSELKRSLEASKQEVKKLALSLAEWQRFDHRPTHHMRAVTYALPAALG